MTRAILTCSPLFETAAVHELRRSVPTLTEPQALAPGFLSVEAPISFGKLTAPWHQRLPIYLHHLFPVHAAVPLTHTLSDLPSLRAAAQSLASPDAVIQVRIAQPDEFPYSCADIQQAVTGAAPVYSTGAPRGRVLSMLLTGDCAFIGISWAQQNLSPYTGGQVPITEPVSNRAGYKLLEALHSFDIRLRPGDSALDLGAAPGAWTTLLRRRRLNVTAVAPSPLYPWLMFDAGVDYQPVLAEAYLARCQTTFDLIVNDMIIDAQDSARLMVDYAPHLRRGGIAIMTIKLHSQHQRSIVDHTLRLLRKAYKIIRVRNLVSNKRELTLFLRRKD